MTSRSTSRACSDLLRSVNSGRRSILRAGTWGLAAQLLGQHQLPAALTASEARGSSLLLPGAKAKRCIFLFMWGGPSQLDTWDPKPEAPAEVRGPFAAIESSVPGVRICEHFRRVSQRMQHVAVIRSLTHDDPSHLASAHCTLTGQLAPVVKSDAEPPSDRDTPHLGALMAACRPAPSGLPPFVTMPWMAFHPAAAGGKAPGQNGGWLGHRYDPFLVTGDPSAGNWSVPELRLLDQLSLDRLAARRTLLQQLDQQQRLVDLHAARQMTGQQQSAFELLTSRTVRQAFDLAAEPAAVRDAYGRNTHGQSVLLARRLVEQGVPFVSVNWHNDGRNFWDTHGNNFERLQKDLIPPADQALSALLDDLERRGLLEETIVAWVGEFGRRPQITPGNAGREHWPWCYSGLLAGGGIRGGQVYGASDNQAAYPESDPVSPQDFAATILKALGVAPEATLFDRSGRPHRAYGGQPVESLFG